MITLLPPKSSLAAIASIQKRERLRELGWGFPCWLTALVAISIAAMTLDFQIDKYRDTPIWLRVFLLILQIGADGYLAWRWILKPLFHIVAEETIARRIEVELPEYGHRLVTSIQLTRQTAQREGMSDELIFNLTREAEGITSNRDLSPMVRGRRYEYSFGVFLVAVLFASLFWVVLGSKLAGTLFGRQFMLDTEIPHDVQLVNQTPELWPAGEEVTITYEATGPLKPENEGEVRVKVGGLNGEDYPLKFAFKQDDIWTFKAVIPPGTKEFSHRAWLRGGRSKNYGTVRYEPRPVISRIDAWVQIPEYVGVKPDGSPYETYMPQQGEIVCFGNSTVRVELDTSKSIKEGRLHLLGYNDQKKEVRLRSLPLAIRGGDANVADCKLTIEAAATAYELEVIDNFGFQNAILPRRGIRVLPDVLPQVDILPEHFTGQGELLSADAEVEGMPLPLGKPLRIDYRCSSPLGLSRARLAFRVNEDPWNFLTLTEVKPTEETGPWDFTRHSFEKIPYQKQKLGDQVEFTALPSLDLNLKPSRLEGAGSFTFQTKTLKKLKDGKLAELEVGDRVEYYIEVFDRNPATGREPGKSETRSKEIVTEERFYEWILSTLQNESKLRDLQKKQQSVFEREK